MVTTLDPRDLDRHHTVASHRPDLPSAYQTDLLWSYAEQPGGWYSQSAATPEPATWLLLSLGMGLLLWGTKRKVPQPRNVC